MYFKKQKNGWALFLLLLAGIVLGGAIGEWIGMKPAFEWLRYGFHFGFDQPFVFDIKVLVLTLGISIKLNIAGIIGMILAIVIYRNL